MRYNSAMAGTRRPKLGQHFLASPGYRQRIVDALPLHPEDLIVEIGPGRGAMTALLADRARRVVAVELDEKLAQDLTVEFQADLPVEIIHADILSTDFSSLCRKYGSDQCFVFGNLPYFITSPIIHHLMDSARWIRGMALLVQREVAMRVTARPGSRDYGYLSVLVRLHSEAIIALRVPPGAFSPPPKVHSALVLFSMRPEFPDWTPKERAQFLGFVRQCFSQKRKNLLNNLAGKFGREPTMAALAANEMLHSARAEELPIEKFAALWRTLNRKGT